MNKELIEEVTQWIITSIKSDLPYEFHAKAIIDLCQKVQWISVEKELPDKKVLATYKNNADKNRIIVAEHFKRFEIESMGESDDYDEYCEYKDAYFYREGWYEQQDNWGEYASIFVNEGDITHWQPLPEPPVREDCGV